VTGTSRESAVTDQRSAVSGHQSSATSLGRESRLTTGGWRVVTAAALLLSILRSAAVAAGLTEAPRLAAVYDTILSAQFSSFDAQLRQTCPPAPAEACIDLRAVSRWWQILINPESHRLDGAFNETVQAAIAASDAWTRREPQRAEAWFYVASAYAPLVQWQVLRGERLAAARNGKKIKDMLERALRIDPQLADAYFGIGLYHYYADVAPAYAKFLRWLLLLPGGDRQQGLHEMLTARGRGEVLRGEADYQLQVLYLWYEQKPHEARAILEQLDRKYPTNPLFLQRIAEIDTTYFHDDSSSAAGWRRLLDRALAGRVYEPRIAETRARLGLAEALIAIHALDAAAAQLQIVIAAHPIEPIGARERAETLMKRARAHQKF
jgi:hypothetical protein